MNAGAYKEYVTIEMLFLSADEDGFQGEGDWLEYYSNFAYVNKLSGSERWTAAQVQMDSTVRFTFRWHSQLDYVTPKRYRIRFNNRIFQITNVDNVQFRNETVKIDGIEVTA